MNYCLSVSTKDGEFIAGYSATGLAQLSFPEARTTRPSVLPDLPPKIRAWHRQTIAAVKAVLSGCRPSTLPPFDLSSGTAFQQDVWRALSQIKLGHTQSYGEVASAIGRPKAVRAVGSACGANPIPLLIPCHRVLAAHQRLGGFGGGLDWKRKLLAAEKIHFF